jgi:hypothetical protein
MYWGEGKRKKNPFGRQSKTPSIFDLSWQMYNTILTWMIKETSPYCTLRKKGSLKLTVHLELLNSNWLEKYTKSTLTRNEGIHSFFNADTFSSHGFLEAISCLQATWHRLLLVILQHWWSAIIMWNFIF